MINLSVRRDDNSLLRAAIAYAELSRVVVVPAVGNCGGAGEGFNWPRQQEYDPASCARPNEVAGGADQPTVLGVGAIKENGDHAGSPPRTERR